MARMGLRAYAEQVASAGRNGDTELAHLSPDEIAILTSLQGHESINPDTGLPEFFSLGKVFKGIAKAAGAIAGGYFGGPVGSAIGAGAVSKILGDSTGKALSTGLLAGLGSWGAQQTGIGDIVGGGFSSGANLLGQQAADTGIQTASAMADGVASSGGMGLSAVLPALGIGAAALAGNAKPPKQQDIEMPEEPAFEEYEPLDRDQLTYTGDPYSYGVFGPEFQYFDEVNPGIQPMRDGGRVYLAEGGIGRDGRERTDRGNESGSGNRGGGGSGIAGDRGTMGQQQDRRNFDAARAGGNSAPGVHGGSDRGTSSAIQDRHNMAVAQSHYNTAPGVGNYSDAMDDYNNINQGFSEDPLGTLGRIFGGMFGIGEIDPRTQKPESFKSRSSASWGVDPIGAALGLAGAAGLAPFGTGGLYQGVKSLTGWNGPVIAFDGNQPVSQFSNDSILDQVGDMLGSSGGQPGRAPQGGGTGQSNFGAAGLPANIVADAAAGAAGKPGKQRDPLRPDRDRDELEEPTGRTYVPLSDVYNYGIFGPEHQFFTGQIPMQEVNMRGGGDVRGPGDGQSDDIPAMLSNGEYVMDAETVSALGDGSTEAGAKKLDVFRKNLRKHKRSTPTHKIPPVAKSISAYMRSAA